LGVHLRRQDPMRRRTRSHLTNEFRHVIEQQKRKQLEERQLSSASELVLEAFLRPDGGDGGERNPPPPSLEEFLLPGALDFGFVDRVSSLFDYP
ncbi:hypothetical protein GW17_00052158, partial [Ensete ventricosum]